MSELYAWVIVFKLVIKPVVNPNLKNLFKHKQRIYNGNWTKGRTIRKVTGGRGIFEPQKFFVVIKFLVWIFFSFNFAVREYFFLYFAPPPPHKFSNGPSLSGVQFGLKSYAWFQNWKKLRVAHAQVRFEVKCMIRSSITTLWHPSSFACNLVCYNKQDLKFV